MLFPAFNVNLKNLKTKDINSDHLDKTQTLIGRKQSVPLTKKCCRKSLGSSAQDSGH